MAIKKAKSDVKQRIQEQQERELYVSEEAQNRLAEILADAPTIVKLAGTEWEMRPLRFGTQYLIVNEICKMDKLEHGSYGDVLKGLYASIPAISKILTLALLNDKNKIFQNGDTNAGFSKLFKRTYDTIMWGADGNDLSTIFLECMELVDVNFFMQTLGMLRVFRGNVTKMKRTRTKTAEQR